ncbi:DUF6635 family protein [Marinivivus vitaminiproducens]|uniref:DUF6635 family protein n=1 Tax=Marinivivus vitaminiproducens TaxID=3035935 RepID=UPI00279FB0D6|nr:hypothetical protein P4R82_18160 [Geminicoccaceae bacterium SCSIO 64248]
MDASPSGDGMLELDRDDALDLVDRAVDRYVAQRHAQVVPFVDRHFSPLGALRLHRHAFGLDVLKAPANVALVAPYLVLQLGAAGLERARAARAASWLRTRKLFLDTDVARELEWLLHAELLELPHDDGKRRSETDALGDAILADPRIQQALHMLAERMARHRDDPELRLRLQRLIGTYAGTRSAAAEILNNLALAGTGAVLFQQLTPGALSLGPVLAGAVAHQAAVASFPLGASMGGMWYGVFAVQPSTALVVGMTGGLMAVAATTAAFSGIVTDPVQRALGLHQKRLHRLIDALGGELKGDSAVAFQVRDHYVARLFDVVDVLRAAWRVVG